MTNLHFENSEEFANIFKQKTKNVTDVIVQGIEKAVEENKKSANLFSITFQDAAAAVNPLSHIAGLGLGALGLARLFRD